MRLGTSITLTFGVISALALGSAVLLQPERVVEMVRSVGPEEPLPPVRLIVVGDPLNVDTVRHALRDEVPVHDSADAFALVDGTIVAARIEDASDALNQLGWIDRPLEILAPPSASGASAGAAYSPGSRASYTASRLEPGTASDGGPSLAELAKKPTLTPGEAIRALRMLR